MTTAIHCPDDATWHRARANDVTASVIGALLGEHEYETAYGLFLRKTGAVQKYGAENGQMRRGRLMEDVAAQILREERPEWIVMHNAGLHRLYYRDPDARIGATPDAIAELPSGEKVVVQFKSVAAVTYRKKWMVDGVATPPSWIILQTLVERELVGAERCAVAPLVIDDFGNIDMPLIDIPTERSDKIMARVRSAVGDFWRRVAENDPPAPDFTRDGDAIAALYGDDDGGEIDLSGNARIVEIMCARDELKKREADGADAAKQRKVYDAEIIHTLGNAARGRLADGRLIEAKTVRRAGYTVQPSQYRPVKVKEARA